MVVRPRPGGRAPAEREPRSSSAAVTALPESDVQVGQSGRLLTPAMPLLQLMARLSTMITQPNAAALRQRIDAELTLFEQRAAKADVPLDQVRRAHFALCVGLDDRVLGTPWGAASAWVRANLTAAHHPAVSADRFFDVLRQAEGKGAVSLPLVQLMHACLSLSLSGIVGAEVARAEAHIFIQHHAPAAPLELSSAWRGVDAPFVTRRNIVPFWVVVSAGLATVAGLYLLASNRVNDQSDAVFAAMIAAPPAQMPMIARDAPIVPPAPAPVAPSDQPTARDLLRDRLRAADILNRDVSVAGTPGTPVVRIATHALFRPGSAVVLPTGAPLLVRLSQTLRGQAGGASIIGYTDNLPFRSIQFASNFELSAAQAQAVATVIAPGATGWSAEGRGPSEPVSSNATPDGREQNRRIDIVLHPPG